MSLTSLSFLIIYFPVLLILYFNPWIKNNTFRKVILLCASIGLYAFCEPIYSLLLLGLIFTNYSLVKLSERTSKDWFRVIAIVTDASTLLFFKYVNKVMDIWSIHQETTRILMPIGLSYFSFKAISYVVDSKNHKGDNIIDVAIYMANFLTIVSGPLCTYQDELPMIQKKTEMQFQNIYVGIERLSVGLMKKTIIADNLGVLVNQSFSFPELSCVMAWAGAIAYTLQLYFDFSGYTDMAIGVGTIFGFSLPENFNYPYMATSISEFWKRWHISLTKWFTRYMYVPLGGSRVKSVYRHVFNALVVWVVTGIWHGSNMTFIVWAMVYFVLQMLEKHTKLTHVIKKLHVGHVYTMLVVTVEWVIFKAEDLAQAAAYIRTMFMVNGNAFISSYDVQSISKYVIPLTLGLIFSTNVGAKIKMTVSEKSALNMAYNGILIALYLACITISISQGYIAPLYAGF